MSPPAPGSGEIAVAMHGSSLNFHDLLVVQGNIPTDDERIPLSDGAGIVDAVGSGVTDFAVGDTVVSTFFPDWLAGGATAGDFSRAPGNGLDGYSMHAALNRPRLRHPLLRTSSPAFAGSAPLHGR
ncbi:alcohol dehydrogenase catalytic domain-containing protein [Sphingobium sp. ba1]|uniref:alcohol dehydrogenase catalytic domain-containing protein n=1 Tax=Sphingobium sp. ba1 TaxID=1522072 RepID=UPI0009715239|nr:alcohol dehydrogenase catalytic domain-containing protein [Sphingobium sp. ba1]